MNKGDFAALSELGLPVMTAPSGEKLAYLGLNAFPGAEGNTALYAAHVGTRTATGWKSTDWTPANSTPEAFGGTAFAVDYTFSEDLTQAIVRVPYVALAPGATPNVANLFLRNPDGHYTLVNSAAPAISEESICPQLRHCWEFLNTSSFAGASADFSHVAFESSSQLTSEAPGPIGIESLYEAYGGAVHLVGILPDGNPAGTSTLGQESRATYATAHEPPELRVEHAVSQDGSRIVFQAPADAGQPDALQAEKQEVYDRIEGRETVELSAPEIGATPKNNTPQPATYWAAATDGTRVFFTSAADLTTEAATGALGGEDLYEYDFNRPLGSRLADLSADANPIDSARGAEVKGIVNVSTDGSYVYFVAAGELIPGKGVDGQPNLYVAHAGEPPVFIATLNGQSECSFITLISGDACDWSRSNSSLEAYVTPDGRHLAFMSTMRLATAGHPAGYSNSDKYTGEPDSEVYEYNASTAELVCVSCGSGSEAPRGNALLGSIDLLSAPQEVGEKPYFSISGPFEQARPMNDSGTRVFYDAPSPSGTSLSKVYEYEQDGEATCTESAGCHFMVSAEGPGLDKYLGTSSSGNDVFFSTALPLVPTDSDSLVDVYDARVGGGSVSPSSEPSCAMLCRTTNPPLVSVGLVGAATAASGNLPPLSAVPSTKRRPTTQRRFARALRKCHVERNRRRRAKCEVAARRRYGAAARARTQKRGSKK